MVHVIVLCVSWCHCRLFGYAMYIYMYVQCIYVGDSSSSHVTVQGLHKSEPYGRSVTKTKCVDSQSDFTSNVAAYTEW